MLHRFQYFTEDDRARLLLKYGHWILVEEQNIAEGNFLLFSEHPIITQPTIEEKILAENQYQTMLLELTNIGGM